MAVVQPKNLKYRVAATHFGMLLFLTMIILPFLVIISISLREGNFATGSLIPETISWEHWQLALGMDYTDPNTGDVREPPFPVLLWLWNSIKVAFLSGFMIVVLSTTGAYAFARMQFRFKTTLLASMMIFQMFPAVLALVAIYALFNQLGTYVPWLGLNTHGALVLASLGSIAMHIWITKGYFDSIDVALEESAAVDGATRWQAFWHILLPLSVPILAVVFILSFIQSVNEYPVASVVLQETEKLTLAVGSRQYLYEQNYLWGDFAAAAVMSGVPITIVFLFAQRWIVGGLTSGGVKG